MTAVDHRRATAERNAAALLDAAERLMAERRPLSMAAIATEAGLSRPTLYAHYKTLADLVEAVVARSVTATLGAIEAAEPARGPAPEALRRMIAASWDVLAGFDAMAAAAHEHLSAEAAHRSHVPLMTLMLGLVERGQADGSFRADLRADWLVSAYFALVHASDDFARTAEMPREQALQQLIASVESLFAAR